MPEESELIPRLMRETVDGGLISFLDGVLANQLGFHNYEFTQDLGHAYLFTHGYFDLSGYSKEQKTAFIEGAMFQQVGLNDLGAMITGYGIEECRLVSTIPLDNADFTFTDSLGIWNLPGTPQSTFSMQQVVNGTVIEYAFNQGALWGIPTQSQTWGMADATAASKLYYARAFRFDVSPDTGATYKVAFCPIVVAVPIIVAAEPDLEYIMRLKRSVELTE